MSEVEPLLSVKDLHRTFTEGERDLQILRGVNLTLAQGEWVSIHGRSGSGKSTLLHLIAGLDRADAGRITFEGTDLTALPGGAMDAWRNRRMGLVFQAYHLLPELSALENVLLAAMISDHGKEPRKTTMLVSVIMATLPFMVTNVLAWSLSLLLRGLGVHVNEYALWGIFALIFVLWTIGSMGLEWLHWFRRRHAARARAESLLKQVGLGERLHHKPAKLSGGERQRVAIARALMNQPALLLADEPTGNLDTQTADEVLAIFRQLRAEGVAILLVTHDETVAGMGDRIVHLQRGVVVEAQSQVQP